MVLYLQMACAFSDKASAGIILTIQGSLCVKHDILPNGVHNVELRLASKYIKKAKITNALHL